MRLLLCLATLGQAREARVDAAGAVSFGARPFCEKLCEKSNLELRGARSCEELSEEDCKSLSFYQKSSGEFRLCLWQRQRCGADRTTACLAEELRCGAAEAVVERCEAMCYMTDLRSVDGSCRMLSPAECASGQFYESDLLGNRSACALLSGGCGTSWNCSSSVICRSQVHFDAPEASEACGPLCHMTNTLVSGLSCRDLSLAQCSSEQFYESDQEGERRRCVLALQGCVADPRAACPASRPLCDAQVPVASGSEPCRECAATCLTFCDKINTRSRKGSCRSLSETECLSGLFYETDRRGDRRLCGLQGTACRGNASALCAAWRPICPGLEAPRRLPRAVHLAHVASEPASAAFGGLAHSGAPRATMGFAILGAALR